MIKCIHIKQYRKLRNIDIDFSNPITVISGTNGTCKSSLLYLVSNSFQEVKTTASWLKDDTVIKNIKNINMGINLKIESLTKGDEKYNDPAKGEKGTLFSCDYENGDSLEFRRHNTRKRKDGSTKNLVRESITKAGNKEVVGGNTFQYYTDYGHSRDSFETKEVNNIVFDKNGLTVNKGFVATDTLTVPYGHFPLIKLFGDANEKYFPSNAYPSVDATFNNNSGFGDRIRLKWRNDCYISIGGRDAGSFNVYVQDYEYGGSTLFNVSNTGIFYKRHGIGYIIKEGTTPDDPQGVSIVFPGWGKLRIRTSGAMRFESTNKGDIADVFQWNN